MQDRPTRQELQARLNGLRTAVVYGSGVAFLVALGLVAAHPVGTQASTASADAGRAAEPGSEQQAPATNPGAAYQSNPNPVTNVPQAQYQQPVLRSRRS